MRTFKKCVSVEFHRVNGDALSRASCSCRRRRMCRCNPSDFQRKRRRPLRSWTIQPTGCKRRASQRSASMRHWAIVEFIRAKRILLQALSEGRVVDGATFVIGAHRLRFFCNKSRLKFMAHARIGGACALPENTGVVLSTRPRSLYMVVMSASRHRCLRVLCPYLPRWDSCGQISRCPLRTTMAPSCESTDVQTVAPALWVLQFLNGPEALRCCPVDALPASFETNQNMAAWVARHLLRYHLRPCLAAARAA